MDASPDQQLPGDSWPCPRLHVRIRAHDTTLVPPSPPETSLPLTFFDVIWLHSPAVERLFLYRLAADADVAAIISSLKDSLRHAVRDLYPLAGRVRLTPGTSDRYELHYRPGDAFTFTVAECDADDDAHLDTFATDAPREVAKIAALVPPLPQRGALFAVQVTILPARRGLAIGVAVHHAACDGSGSTHFQTAPVRRLRPNCAEQGSVRDGRHVRRPALLHVRAVQGRPEACQGRRAAPVLVSHCHLPRFLDFFNFHVSKDGTLPEVFFMV